MSQDRNRRACLWLPAGARAGATSARRAAVTAVLALSMVAGHDVLDAQESTTTVVYLVRHAEPSMDGGTDPGLNDLGRERAHALAILLGDDRIDGVFSSDYKRTRETIGPLADKLGVSVTSYDPRDLATFASELRSRTGRFVVSGHSNTTPRLAELLGGEPGPPINESYEFDRLYVLFLRPNAPATTLRLRYGPPSGR